VPVKDSDRRKAAFEERHGEGAVELDALEALHPGQFERTIREAVAPYRDEELADRLQEARDEALEAAREAWDEATADVRRDLAEIQGEARSVVAEFEARLADLDRQLQERLAPLTERLEAVRHAAQLAAGTATASLPSRPPPVTPGTVEAGWLFDAARAYEAQLAHYKARKRAAEVMT
jgi:hypothetical protein